MFANFEFLDASKSYRVQDVFVGLREAECGRLVLPKAVSVADISPQVRYLRSEILFYIVS